MDSTFEWPSPPYFKAAVADGGSEVETCVLYLRDGRKVLGDLLAFSPEVSQLVFLPTRNEVSETIPLDRIKSVRLVKSWLLKPESIALEKRAKVRHSKQRLYCRRGRRITPGRGSSPCIRPEVASIATRPATAVDWGCMN